MPEPVIQQVELPAKLELDDGARMVGDLSVLPDGSLQLSGTSVIRLAQGQKQLKLQPGTKARLELADATEVGEATRSNPVTLSKIEGKTLILLFADAAS